MSAVSSLLTNIASSFVFWAAWIVIPLIMEIVPALGSVGLLVHRRIRDRELPPEPALWPDVTVIVPVYNSADTLEACVDSIAGGTYPAERINVYLVNNASSDNSFEVFAHAQAAHPELAMQWLDAAQGKSNALNLALYNSQGKYIVHVDSDGVLEPHALANLVRRFEADHTANVATGAIMVEPSLVEAYRPGPARLLRRLEFMEYAQAFLAGRNYASEVDRVYTLSGAFTAFRSSAILTSWLYNADTICEDTQIAFQMRYNQRQRLHVCEDAIFFVDPIEGVDKLYTQRQRWQRGSLEVAHQFGGERLSLRHALTDVNVGTLLYDHTFAFPRIIWYVALVCLLAVATPARWCLAPWPRSTCSTLSAASSTWWPWHRFCAASPSFAAMRSGCGGSCRCCRRSTSSCSSSAWPASSTASARVAHGRRGPFPRSETRSRASCTRTSRAWRASWGACATW